MINIIHVIFYNSSGLLSTSKLNYTYMIDIINKINKKYVKISNRLTSSYEKTFSLPCDLYLPIFNSFKEDTRYRDVKMFAPHQSCSYNPYPDYTDVPFYIVGLIKKDNLNTSELEFSSAYTEEEASNRPYIETSKKRELPTQTKVVVKQGKSVSKFFIDKKLAVTGADGFMLLRMYLSPLMKDNDEEDLIELEQEEFISPIEMEIPDDDF